MAGCDACAQQALGVLSEADYTTRFPGVGCTEQAERLYCVGGELSVPPPPCVRVYGDAFHRFGSFPGQPEAAGGAIAITGTDITVETSHAGTGREQSASVTNDSCYPMQLVYFESDSMTYAVDDPNADLTGRFNGNFSISRDGTRKILAGGVSQVVGNNNDPIDGDSSGFAFVDTVTLAPGVTTSIAITLITSSQSVGALARVIAFGAAVRIIGFPQC